MVHISEVADVYVKDIKSLCSNDQVKVKILSMQKRKVVSDPSGPTEASRQNQQSFEDKLAKFLKDSDERQSDLKRSMDSKRGGRGGGRLSHF